MKDKIEIIIGFVIYNPKQDFIDRVKLLIDLNYHIIIFDNSQERSITLERILQKSNLKYFHGGKNYGLGVGLSFINYNSYVDKFKFLLFFDQDTIITKKTISFVQKFSTNKKEILNDFAVLQFSSDKPRKNNITEFEEKKLLLSSGSLFVLKNLSKMNWHNHTYFVDAVDYEFCYRAFKNKFKVGKVYNTPDLDHKSGQDDKIYRFLNHNFVLRKYPNFRLVDSTKAYLRLIIDSFFSLRINFFMLFLKSLVIYCYGQIMVRIFEIIKIKKYEL